MVHGYLSILCKNVFFVQRILPSVLNLLDLTVTIAWNQEKLLHRNRCSRSVNEKFILAKSMETDMSTMQITWHLSWTHFLQNTNKKNSPTCGSIMQKRQCSEQNYRLPLHMKPRRKKSLSLEKQMKAFALRANCITNNYKIIAVSLYQMKFWFVAITFMICFFIVMIAICRCVRAECP